jgi:hypothetical protein
MNDPLWGEAQGGFGGACGMGVRILVNCPFSDRRSVRDGHRCGVGRWHPETMAERAKKRTVTQRAAENVFTRGWKPASARYPVQERRTSVSFPTGQLTVNY